MTLQLLRDNKSNSYILFLSYFNFYNIYIVLVLGRERVDFRIIINIDTSEKCCSPGYFSVTSTRKHARLGNAAQQAVSS